MSKRTRAVDRSFSKSFKSYTPPEPLTVSQWAEKHRILSRESSAEAGPWRNDRTPYMVEPMDAFNDPSVTEISVVAMSQTGKALSVDTPIATPDGWATMGNLMPGDVVFDENGKQCNVIACTGIMNNRKCYKITFSDGSEIIADADHKWYVEGSRPIDYPDGKNRKAIYNGVVNTEKIASDFSYKQGEKTRNKYAIPVSGPLETSEAVLPLDPYVFGVWLGDGNSYSSQLTINKDDVEIIENIRKRIPNIVVRDRESSVFNVMLIPKENIHDAKFCIRGHDMDIVGRTKKGLCAECARQYSKHHQYGFVMDDVINEEITGHKILTSMDVLKNKHIPCEYLRASYRQRLDLLNGIMDTDGTIGKSGRCDLTLKSERLVYGVKELVLSLGMKCTVAKRKAVCTNSPTRAESVVYKLSFMAYSDVPVFKLERKLKKMKPRDGVGIHGKKLRTSETDRRQIVNVEEIPSVPVKCISVDSKSRLYLAGESMIPTHNSEIELNIIGYAIDQDPGSTLYVQPNLDDAKKFSRLRISPMLRDSPRLRNKVAEVKSRDSGNTVLQKTFPGGMLTIVGSQSPSALASTPARYVIGDEIDRWALSAGTEGDPWSLAAARTTTFYNAKRVAVSTPTIKGFSRIEKLYYDGTQERWCSQCPDCGEWHDIVFDDIKFDFETIKAGKSKTYQINYVNWCCPSCGCIHSEEEMRAQPAKWIALNPDAIKNGRRSFWVNAFSSPWRSWATIVRLFLESKDDPQKLKVFYNTILGECWEDRGGLIDEDEMLSRREDYGTRPDGTPVDLPDGVLVLTCGVDTQDAFFSYEVVGHGHYGETWGIKKGVVMGDPNDDDTWNRLDDVIDKVYRFEDGRGLTISMTCIDSGGHKTQSVYKHCRDRIGKRVFAIKGVGGDGVPFTRPPSKVDIVINGRKVSKAFLYSLGVDSGKATIMSNIKVEEPGPKYCHFPKGEERGYDHSFFTELLSEKLVMKSERGRTRWAWERIQGIQHNEALDARNYALAALRILDPNMDAVESRLRSVRSGSSTESKKQPVRRRGVVKKNSISTDDW